LALNVNAVIRQIGLEHQAFDIVLLGSVFNAGEQYLQPFRQTVFTFAPGANIIPLTVPPVVGALLLAAETMGIKANSIRQKLLDSLEDFTENNFT
jgi:N-acetylglucosamine kinase-like BadF-type ATPase